MHGMRWHEHFTIVCCILKKIFFLEIGLIHKEQTRNTQGTGIDDSSLSYFQPVLPKDGLDTNNLNKKTNNPSKS